MSSHTGSLLEPQLSILWSDEDLLVVDKPARLLVIPDGYDPDKPHLAAILAAEHGRLWIVHRLDRDTSGVIVLARNPGAHRALNDQFSTNQVEKTYHALVLGDPAWDQTTANLPLRPNGDRRHRTVIDSIKGKPAVTHLKVLERFDGYALVEARPQTGRTHQIRAHLSNMDLPILADSLYGDGTPLFLSALKPGYRSSGEGERPLIDRLALHAWYLTFQHPCTQERLHVQAPYPKDFSLALKQLRRYG
jgi:RluA family pseudouridine synthase